MRRAHYIKENKGVEIPTQCIFFDTETNEHKLDAISTELQLRLGVAIYTRRMKDNKWSEGELITFNRGDELLTYIVNKTRPKCKLYVYAHNLIFDMTTTQLINRLTDNDWKLVNAIVDDPPNMLQFRKDKCSIEFLDTFNYFKSSVKDLGASLGLPKIGMPKYEAEDAIWQAYCRRDVQIIMLAMLTYFEFICTNDLGNNQITIAAQAFTAYRHRFMFTPLFCDDNPKALALARQAYHGGRTECFFVGKQSGQYHTVDINSMYPYVMALYKYPVKLRGIYQNIPLSELNSYLQSSCVIAEVVLDTNEPVYPKVLNDKLIFPIGNFVTTLTTPSLNYAMRHNHIISCKQAAVYSATVIFQAYVNTLYNLRQQYKQQGNPTFALMAKYMLNTLYGKFGQQGRVFDNIDIVDNNDVKAWKEYDMRTGLLSSYRQFGGIVQQERKEGESFNSHPAIAAHVTDYARMYLWQLIQHAGIDNVYYVDTDSLTINDAGYIALADYMDNERLGLLKTEYSFNDLTIYAPKDYVFGDRVKTKGIRRNAILIGNNTYEQDKFIQFKGMIRQGDIDRIMVMRQRKHLRRIYDKGTVTASGRVTPIHLPVPVVAEILTQH